MTGLSLQSSEIAPKRIEVLREAIPGLGRLAVLANAAYPTSVREFAIVQEVAGKLGITVSALDIHRAEEIAPAINALNGKMQALYVCTESLLVAHAREINAFALGAHVATLWNAREFMRLDGFISLMEPMSLTSFGSPPVTRTRFSTGPGQPISPWRSRQR